MENLFKLDSIESFDDNEDKYENQIIEPNLHFDETKGKGFSDVLIQAYNYWLRIDEVDVEVILGYFKGLHTNLSLVDDIQDWSELRRGIPAAHLIYGVGRTITSIDYFIFRYYLRNSESRMMRTHPESLMIILNTVSNILKGQIKEIYWRDNFVCPSEEEYLDMALKKTGAVFWSIDNLMKLCSKNTVDLTNLSSLFGTYLQIADDYRGLQSKTYFRNKGFCDDIREGKFIFPIVHAINSRPNDKQILDILKMHTTDVHLKIKCLELLDEFGSMEYTRNKLFHYKNLILQEMEKIGYNDSFLMLFELQNQDE